jgi:hypothetical protein
LSGHEEAGNHAWQTERGVSLGASVVASGKNSSSPIFFQERTQGQVSFSTRGKALIRDEKGGGIEKIWEKKKEKGVLV